jgi:uncharacterized protein (TIGR02217 family)
MTLPTFPVFAGQGIEVRKTPKFDSAVAPHASGRETRTMNYLWPIFEFELTFEGLDISGTGKYGHLGAGSMQTLAGFYESVGGQYGTFLYTDPTDNSVTNQAIGTGDGSMKTFTMFRSIDGWTGPVAYVSLTTAVYLNGVLQSSGWSVTNGAPYATITFTSAPGNGATITATFTYDYICRFSEDVQDYEEFMSLLAMCKVVKFQTVRGNVSSSIAPVQTPYEHIVIIDNPSVTSYTFPSTLTRIVSIEAFQGGNGGGCGQYARPAGDGGDYAVATSFPTISPGDTCTVVIGAGGAGGTYSNTYGGEGGTTLLRDKSGSIIIKAGGSPLIPTSPYPAGYVGGAPGTPESYYYGGSGPGGGGPGGGGAAGGGSANHGGNGCKWGGGGGSGGDNPTSPSDTSKFYGGNGGGGALIITYYA